MGIFRYDRGESRKVKGETSLFFTYEVDLKQKNLLPFTLYLLPLQMISIEQIRQELTWKLRRDVLYPGETIDNVQLDEDDDAIHFGAFKDDHLVGVVSLFQQDIDFQFRKLAVDWAAQKMGIGTALLAYITVYVRENGGLRLWCNARTPAIGFYLKNGFKLTGKSFSKNNIDYVIMDKAIVADTNSYNKPSA